MRQHMKRQPSLLDARIGEQGLLLINNDKEWRELMQSLRTSGISTNGAARAMILKYLHQKQKEEYDDDGELIETNIIKPVMPSQSAIHAQRLQRRSVAIIKNVWDSCAKITERRASI